MDGCGELAHILTDGAKISCTRAQTGVPVYMFILLYARSRDDRWRGS